MALAMPVNRQGNISVHVGKAPKFRVLSKDGSMSELDNPMDATTCRGRCKLVAALEAAGVTRVLVRQIGERTLGRFLNADFAVYRAPRGLLVPVVTAQIPVDAEQLMDASHGRTSKPRQPV